MELKGLFLLLCALVNLGLGVYIIWHNPKRLQNRVFSLFIFILVVWSSVNFLIATSGNIDLVAILGKFAYAVGSLIPATFATFVYFFPTTKKEISKKPLYFIYAGCVLLIILCFTPLIQAGVKITEAGFRPIFGPLYSLFAVYEIIGMSYGLGLLYRKWKLSDNKYEQLQIKFNFVGILIATTIALVGSVIFPVFGISAMVYLGPTVTVVIIGFTTYTIVRYRLFDITVVIKKTVIYTLLTASITASYLICVLLVEKVLKGIVKYQTFLPALFSAIFIAFVFLPLREKIQALVDKIFYKQKYAYQTILKETGEKLTKVATLPKLLRFLLESITKAMGIRRASIWLSEGNVFIMKSRIGNMPLSRKTKIDRNDDIVRWLKNKKDVLIYEELDKMRLTKESAKIKGFLKTIEAEIAVPIARDEELVGIIFLGEKFMGDIFSQNDIDLLLAIANQAAVTIENARLFTEIEQAKVYQENILKNLASAVIVTDKEDKIRIFNEKAEQITGISVSQVIGKNHKKVLPEIFSRFIIDAKKFGKGLSSHEIEYIKDKGKPMILGVGTAVMRSQNNRVDGITLVLADLTEIRALEHQLNRAEELATVGTLAAGMAHEIKNPLVAINTFFELLPEKYDDPEFRGEFSEAAREEVKKINDLIHRLLHFAQPKPPNFNLNHIHACIDENLRFMSTKLNNHNITVVKKYSPAVPESFVDKTRFDEILLNLLLNAIEAMEEKGGRLYITTSYKKISNVGKILLEIRDTGEGIPSENLPRIFDPFFTTKNNGTGLGLAIVYRAVTDHGGKIEVESKVNKGTSFLISLPVFLRESEYKLITSKP